jgi:hypothetical protein
MHAVASILAVWLWVGLCGGIGDLPAWQQLAGSGSRTEGGSRVICCNLDLPVWQQLAATGSN